MKNVFKKWIFALLFIFGNFISEVKSQTIYKDWKSQDEYATCIMFKKKGFSAIGGDEQIKIKLKGNNLIVYDYYQPRLWIFGRDRYTYTILELSENRLVLKPNSIVNIYETLGIDTLYFIAKPKGCWD